MTTERVLPTTERPDHHRRRAALLAPVALIPTTYVMFQVMVGWLGLRWGYLGGFLFFWLVWCGGFSVWVLGRSGLVAVLQDARPRLPRPQPLWLVLLAIPVMGGFAAVLLPELEGATPGVIGVAWLLAGVNATLEELLWRGVYIRLFPGRLLAGWLYPAAMFALWHISPTSVLGSPVVMISGALYLGLVYGWVASRTGTVRYTIISHILVNGMGLSFASLLLVGS